MNLTRTKRTGEPQAIPASDGRLAILVPIQIKRRSGRKLVTLPSGAERPRDGEPTPLQLALARGHRLLARLESGEVKSLREIARKQGADSSYVTRMVNLTVLGPDIMAAILDETLPPDLTLFELAVDPPALWEEQWGCVYCGSEKRSYASKGTLSTYLHNRGLSVSLNTRIERGAIKRRS
jgi:hypothetical protein